MKNTSLQLKINNFGSYDNRLLIQKLLLSTIDFLARLFNKDILEKSQIASDGLVAFFKNSYSSILYYRLFEVLLYPLEINAGLSVGSKEDVILRNSRDALRFSLKNNTGLIIKTKNKKDQYLNMLLKLRLEIREHPTIQANLVQLFSEFLNPLLADFRILKRNDMIARLSLILKFKEEFFNYLKSNVKKETRFFNHRFPKIDFVRYGELIEIVELKNNVFLKEYVMIQQDNWKKGFSTKVSDILGITRQIIDRNYNYLNFSNLRNLDATIWFYLQENY